MMEGGVRMRRCGGGVVLTRDGRVDRTSRLIKLSSPVQQQATLRERQKGITHIILSDAELMVALRWYDTRVRSDATFCPVQFA